MAPAALVGVDDDVTRQLAAGATFRGIAISQQRFAENGFDWHILRFVNQRRPVGPLWAVPHDDEDAAFDAGLAALRRTGGVMVAVNSGPGSSRFQYGDGRCGGRPRLVVRCDPNRNFSADSPRFTAAFLAARPAGQPVIALHTNRPGFAGDGSGGRGVITIWDAAAWRQGLRQLRPGAFAAANPRSLMDNANSFAILPYLAAAGGPGAADVACRTALTTAGVHVWHEPVGRSDGSMSNHLVLTDPNVAYVNMESRLEADIAVAAARHRIMIAAYLSKCRG